MNGSTILFPDWLKGKNSEVLVSKMGEITSRCIIITSERKEHIRQNHENDFEFISDNLEETLLHPDLILEDCSKKETLLVLKQFSDCGLNVIVRLQIAPNEGDFENSVITAFKVGEVSICRLLKKNNCLIDFK